MTLSLCLEQPFLKAKKAWLSRLYVWLVDRIRSKQPFSLISLFRFTKNHVSGTPCLTNDALRTLTLCCLSPLYNGMICDRIHLK
ncbi:hypothetical protein BSUA_01077 [Bacillus subtilis subsp. subtilis str. JH642 substr. AG174]|nr:Hypothetical protein YhaY [Bacillus subtilis subsp. subtilis str. BSP1]AIC39366.1 hypothetical protein BSUA_01077 [Bacillus subtilis subsp. subtilis str. JH642 substr. AG174]AIC43598.1 hypothetical protein BSUB_01077 [Bacillus subtilis subsp. subtilis str. AG1839]CAA74442.1 hypothetical protein [Bacillus subtilis subsp. subtilis str. 168]